MYSGRADSGACNAILFVVEGRKRRGSSAAELTPALCSDVSVELRTARSHFTSLRSFELLASDRSVSMLAMMLAMMLAIMPAQFMYALKRYHVMSDERIVQPRHLYVGYRDEI